LAGALSILAGRDLLPSANQCFAALERLVRDGGAVDGVTRRREPTVDGLEWSVSLRMLEQIRQLIVPSPLERRAPITVGILGYGEAGRAAAALLARQGHRVCISEERSVTLDAGLVVAGVETGGHTIRFLGQCDLVVASPGVREDALIRNELHRRGIPVVSELELAYQLCPYGLIAVTGTIGKRTTVELIRRAFESAGRKLSIGGNKGRPLSALLLDEGATDPIALAVSSFQLESVVHFRPHIAVLLNLDEAHLDRHRSIAEYVRIKSRIFMNHRPDDVLILPYDDPRLRALARKHHGRTLFVSRSQPVDRGAWLEHDAVLLNLEGELERIDSAGQYIAATGAFAEDFLCAILAAWLCGISTAELANLICGEGDGPCIDTVMSPTPRQRKG
jgi:UDP-N-acetylmuramoylalanine--D-glutamate ligase